MKRLKLLMLFVTLATFLSASEWVELKTEGAQAEKTSLVSSNINSSTLHFTMDGFWKEEVETSQGKAWKINTKNGASILKQGAPDLPIFASSIIIPNTAKMEIKIVSSQFVEYENVLVAPSKGNLLRTIDPSTVPYEFGKYYTNDSFYPKDIAKLRDPYIVRDFRGQTVLIQPIQYNPVTQTLRVYYDITLEVVETGISTINTLDTEVSENIVESFHNIYSRQFLNYSSQNKYTPVEESGNMLIISYGDFMDEVQPFIDWKIMSGTPVEIVDVASIGGSSDIKQYIADYYTNNGLTFVLLVGDAPQVPSSIAGGQDSDVDYSYVAGNDHYPDLFVGRFSAETEDHVFTQVQRVLDYEKTPNPDPDWYSQAIGIASSEGTGDDGEYDYEHMRNIGDNKLLPFTYDYMHELYDGSQGGNDAAGNPSSSMVTDAINTGASIINYVGHGSTTSWSTTGFSNSNVNNLNNPGRLPFIFSVACVNGNFVNNTCFAEAWLRASDEGEPTGAIATFMSTINQSWDPPMRGQDEMNDILTEAYSDNIKRTFGGISMNGCMNMNDVYGSAGDDMTDTWTIFGDPSLEIRTAAPQNLTVSHSPTLLVGATSLPITCDAEGSLATLSMDGEILGSAIIVGGTATITFEALGNLGTTNIVVTSFNYFPYISTIDIISASGPFIVYSNNTINDIAGNNNGLMDYGENILLTVALENIGSDAANGVSVTLSSTSEYIELVTTEAVYGDIAADEIVSVTDAFEFIVSEDIPDQIIANFQLVARDNNGIDVWESSFMISGHSPLLEFTGYVIDDVDGNNNGKIEPGETVDLIISTTNSGSSESFNVITELSTTNEYITINTDPQAIGNLQADITGEATFSITADGDTPEGTLALFNVEIIADYNFSAMGDFSEIIGQKPILIIDMANSSTLDSINACFETLQVGSDFVSSWTDDLNLYRSVFVLLGIYPDNHALSTSEGDALAAYLQAGGRVYMEGGDAWAFDDQTSAHELFNIEGTNDGSGNLQTIVGDTDGMMSEFSFQYDGANNYIDQIEPKADAILMFSNSSPEYGTGVSFENETYKTIGTSFEFAGLVDGDGSTKDAVMAEILYFFGLDYTWTSINDNIFENIDIKSFPNPATEIVTIQLDLDQSNEIDLSIFDINGRMVTNIVSNSVVNQGTSKFTWNTEEVEAGIYFYKLNIGKNTITKKIIVIK